MTYDRGAHLRWLVLLKLWQAPTFLCACLVSLVIGALAPEVLTLPSMTSLDRATTPTVIFTALIVAVLAAGVADEPLAMVAAVSPRRVVLWRLGRLGCVTAIGYISLGGLWLSTGPAAAILLLTFVAEARIAAFVLSASLGWTLPVLHAVSALVFGYTATGDPTSWAWFLRSIPQPYDWGITTTLLLAGLACTVVLEKRKNGSE